MVVVPSFIISFCVVIVLACLGYLWANNNEYNKRTSLVEIILLITSFIGIVTFLVTFILWIVIGNA